MIVAREDSVWIGCLGVYLIQIKDKDDGGIKKK